MSDVKEAGRGVGLRAYMGFCDDPAEGAVLAFARNAREARKLAYGFIVDWTDARYIDVDVRWLRNAEVFRHADRGKLEHGIPHVIDSPTGCRDCEHWFAEAYDENGRCEACAESHADWLSDATPTTASVTVEPKETK